MFNIFTYWDGPLDSVHQLCLKTITKHHPPGRVRIFNKDEAKSLLPDNLDIPWDNPVIVSDVFRVWYLKTHGGLWLDADTLVMKPLTFLLDMLQWVDFIATRHTNTTKSQFFTAIMASTPENLTIHRYWELIREGLKTQEYNHIWGALDGVMLQQAVRETETKANLAILESPLFFPIEPFRGNHEQWHEPLGEAHLQFDRYCYGLGHRVIKPVKYHTLDEILSMNTPLGFYCRRAHENLGT